MKITFRMDGGFAVFPGLARPLTIDVDALSAADATRLRDAVVSCRFFERAEPSPTAAPDLRRYEVTVDDAGRRRTLSIPESDDDADLQSLIASIRDRTRR